MMIPQDLPKYAYATEGGDDEEWELTFSDEENEGQGVQYLREDLVPKWRHPQYGSDLPELGSQIVFECRHPQDHSKKLRTIGHIIETPMDKRVEFGEKLVEIPGQGMAVGAKDVIQYFYIPQIEGDTEIP